MTLAALQADVRAFFDMVCVELLSSMPGDDNRDVRVAAATDIVLSLYKGEQRAQAAEVIDEETRVTSPRYVLFSKDFVRGDKVVVR